MSEPSTARPQTRWEREFPGDTVASYVARFDAYERDGGDMAGEARFVDVLAPRGALVLEGGCGTGRVCAAIAERGHTVVGLDRDERLLAIARERYAAPTYAACDLLDVSPERLRGLGLPAAYDVAILPGNVLVYCAPDTQADILRAVASVVRDGGRIAVGFRTGDGVDPDALFAQVDGDGIALEQRFATWHLDPWQPGSDWITAVLRVAR